MVEAEESEKMEIIELERRKQALADYLEIDPSEIQVCSARINNISTFQARRILYLVGTEEEVDAGIRGYFEHNLADLDSTFISQTAQLSTQDAQLVERLCEILGGDWETDILNETLLSIVAKCGDIESVMDAAMAEMDRGEFLALDGKENAFGDHLIYKFREGQCSDFDY